MISAPVKVEAIQPRVFKYTNTFPNKPYYNPPRDFSDVQIIACSPDISVCPVPPNAKLSTIRDELNPKGNGRIYKKSVYETRHQQTIQFCPQLGAQLSSSVSLGGLHLKVLSIRVSLLKEGPAVNVLVGHPETGVSSMVSLRRSTSPDGSFSYNRHCFNTLVHPEDIVKADDDLVQVQFVSIESIVICEATGVWTELRLAVDGTVVPLKLFLTEGGKKKEPWNSKKASSTSSETASVSGSSSTESSPKPAAERSVVKNGGGAGSAAVSVQ
jgi:hypothetical protein